MRLTRAENPEQIEQYGDIKPAPIFGPLRCFARCPGTHRTCTLAKGHSGPHVAHTFFKKVAAVWDELAGREETMGQTEAEAQGEAAVVIMLRAAGSPVDLSLLRITGSLQGLPDIDQIL